MVLLFLRCGGHSPDLSNGHSYGKLYPIEQGSGCGWIDSLGNVVVAPDSQYIEASFFVDGFGFLRKPNSGGIAFYNSRLEVVWESRQARGAEILRGGYGVVHVDNQGEGKFQSAFIDRGGKELFRKDDRISPIEVAYGRIITEAKMPYMLDLKGNAIGADAYDLWPCSSEFLSGKPTSQLKAMWEGLLLVKLEDRVGPDGQYLFSYLDTSGALKPYAFTHCRCFSHGLAVALDSATHLYGYIDHDGHWVIAPQYHFASTFSEGLAPVRGEVAGQRVAWGYIDTTGREVFKFQFEDARPFHDGRALVLDSEQKAYYIDRSGRPVISVPDEYWHLGGGSTFHDGLGLTTVAESEYVVVDTMGRRITPAIKHLDRYSIWWDEHLIYLPGGWMNHQGEWVWRSSD